MSSRPSTLGLADLDRVELTGARRDLFATARARNLGRPEWRARKLSEARDVLALAEIAPRLAILALDTSTELCVFVRLRGPVPFKAPGSDTVQVGPFADIAFRYPEDILHTPLPGWALAQIVVPRGVWHPNCSADAAQRMCLGARTPRGFPLREAILACYAGLALQAVTLDDRDPAGLMNREAGAWWRANVDRIPLSRVPFLGAEDVEAGAEVRE